MKLYCPPELIHIHGYFGIHSYGLFIALAIIISVLLLKKNKRFKELNLEKHYINIICVSIIAGLIGARTIEIITEWHSYKHWYDWFAFWQGGFSVLGSICGIITITPLYLRYIQVPILATFDLVAIYAPLLQSIARLGCLTAGCCYGIATHSYFGIIYTHPETLAPQGIIIHPTQLYSAIALFIIFLLMYYIAQHQLKKKGQLFFLYLLLISFERFIIDFLRADRIMVTHYLSIHQLIALGIIIGTISFYYIMQIIEKNMK